MSSILDEVLASTGLDTNVDNLTVKTNESLERLAQRISTEMQPKATVQDIGNFQSLGVSDATEQDTVEISYLDKKIADYTKRKEEDDARFIINSENLTSSNPFVWGASNLVNMGALAAGTLVNSAENLIAAGSANQRETLNNAIPEDIRDIRHRLDLRNSERATRSEMTSLSNNLASGVYETESQRQAAIARLGELQKRLDYVPPTAAELARLKEQSGLNGMGTWQDVLNRRDEYERTSGRLRGDPKNGEESFTGASNWGNRRSLRNLQERVDDENLPTFEETIASAKEQADKDPIGAAGTLIGGMADRIGTYGKHVLTNPGSVVELVSESAPYIIPATRGLAAAGAGGEIYARGTQEAREENNQHSLTSGQHAGIGALSLAMAGSAAYQGNVQGKLLKGDFASSAGRMTGSVANKVADVVNKASSATLGKTPYIGGVLDAAIRGGVRGTAMTANPVTRVGLAAGLEGINEGVQNIMEQNAGLQGQIDPKELTDSIALGGIAGGAMTAPGTAIDVGVQAFANSQAKRVEKEVGKADTTVEELIDPANANYNPTQAINREILKASSTKDPVTPEGLEESKTKIDEYFNVTKTSLDNSEIDLEKAKNLATLEQEHEAWVAKRDAGLAAAMQSGDEAYIAKVTEYANSQTATREAELERIRANAEKIEALEKIVEDNRNQHKEAAKAYKQFDDFYASKTATTQQAPANTAEEATQLLGAPNFGNVRRMQELASDNTVPEQVRSQLRVVSEALIAENKTKSLADVNKQVMKGVPGFRGMSEYISEMNTAVQNSDMTQQRILTRDIANFEKNLSSKLAALNTAQEAADTQKRQVRILKGKDGEWFADVDHKVSSKEFKSNNGFTVNPHRADGTVGADKTKAAIESNLAAVTATRLALDEISNGSRTRSTPPDTSTMSFEEEMDALNAYERQFGRDTSARDNDPNAVTVNTNENNEGDVIDNSSSNNSSVPAGNPFGDIDFEAEDAPSPLSDTGDFSSTQYDSEQEASAPISQPESQVEPTQQSEEQADNGVDLTGTELQAFNIITQFVTDPDADINKIADTVSFRGNGVRLSEDIMVRWFSVDPAMAADSLRALEQEDLVKKVVSDNSWMINGKPSISYESAWSNSKGSAENPSVQVSQDPEVSSSAQTQPEVGNYSDKDGWSKVNTKSQTTDMYTRTEGDTERVVHVDKETGEVTKDELRTTPKTVAADPETGEEFTFKIYRDSKNPDVITDVRLYSNGKMVQTLGKQGKQTDEQFIKDYVESTDLELTNEGVEADTVIDDDVQTEEVINAKKYPTSKGWKRTELTNSIKYSKDNGDGTETIVNTHKDTGEVLREINRSIAVKDLKNEIRKENREAQVKTYDSAVEEIDTREEEHTGQEEEDLSEVVQEYVTNIDVTDVDNSTLSDGSVDASPAGALDALNTDGKSYKEAIEEEEKKPLDEQNLVKTGFVQRMKDGFNSPLVYLKDFFSYVAGTVKRYRNNTELARELYNATTGKVASNYETQVVLKLLTTLGNDLPMVQDLVKGKPAERMKFAHESYIDWVMVDGKLEENVATAVIAASLDWVAQNATADPADVKAVTKMLGLKDVKYLPHKVHKRLAHVGTYRQHVTEQLGKSIMASLQLKQLSHIDEARRDKLGQALGTVALTYMLQKGMVQMTTFKHRDLGTMKQAVLEYTNGKEDTRKNLFGNPEGTSDFISASLQKNDNDTVELTKVTAGVVRSFGNDVIKDMFSVQRPYKDVSLEPIESTPQTFNGFGSRLSKFQAGVVAKQQATPYELDPGMSRILQAFWTTPQRKGALIRMLGAQNPNSKLKIREKSVQSINQGIERSLNTIQTTMNTTKGKPFYLPISVWSNMRMGIDSAFNPQGDKIHRAFSSLSAERAEIEIGDMTIFSGKANNSLTSYGNFLRALAFRMDGVKVPGVVNGKGLDKNTLDDFLPKLDAYIQSPEVEAAAKALGRIMNGKEEKGDLKLVQDLIAEWGEGDVGQSALTLSALNAIREFTKAKNSNKGTFITSVTPESDGTNNGPAFTHLMMNTLTPLMGKAFGIFRNNPNNTRNLAQYRTLENGKDMYEMLGEIKEIKWAEADVHDELRAAFDGLDNKFAGRNGAKRDLIPFNYGAGYKAIVKANGREFLEGIYDTLESAVLEGNEQKIKDTVAHINTILKFYNMNHKGKVPALKPENFMTMNLELSEQVEMSIRSVDTAVRGPVIKDALKGLLSDYITARDEFNQTGNAAFNLYEPIYKSVATQFIQNIRENDSVRAAMDEGISKQERMELMKSIQKYMPTLQVAMGKESLNGLTSGIPLIDVARVWNDKRGVQVPFKQETKGINRNYKYMFSAISNSTFFEPGVAGLALFIQAHDAYVTARVMQALEVQNQHDSNSTNAHDLEIMAKIQNEAFLDATSISHIGQSFVRAALAPMKAYADGLVLPNLDLRIQVSTAMSALASSVGMDDGGTPISSREEIGQVLQNVIRHMYGKDLAKMDGLMDTYSINQYGTENGEYIITPGKKITLENRKAELKRAMEKDLKSVEDLAKGLSKFLESREDQEIITSGTGSNKFDKDSVAAREVDEVAQETKAEQPLTPLEQDLIKYQKELKDPKRLVKFIQHKLGAYLKDSKPKVAQNAKMYNELLQLAMGSLQDLEVNIVGKGADTSNLLGIEEANAKNIHAWFKAEGTKKQINIRVGEGFRVDSKVLVHELIHASTAVALENLRKEKASGKVTPKHKEAMKSFERLEVLYNHVKDNGTMETYIDHYGISSLDEFIATGLTYPEFMQTLANMPAPPGQDYRLPKTGSIFRDMIDSLLGVFYGFFAPGKKYSAKELSAYEALVIDTAQFVQRTQDVPTLRSLPRVTQLLGAPQEQAHSQVSQMTSSEVFETLPESGDASFDAHLLSTMKQVTDRAFTKIPQSYNGNGYSPEQIWNNALESGEKPYVTEALRNGFTMSAREQFAVEAIEVAMEASIQDKSLQAAYRELEVAFESAKKHLKVEDFSEVDWDKADMVDKANAQQKHDYLFDTSNPEYLARFIAMALGNKEVHSLLNMNVDRKARIPSANKDWFDKAAKHLDNVFDYVTDRHLGAISSDKTNKRIGDIARKFVDIDHKNRNKAMEKIEEVITSVEEKVNELVVTTGNKIGDFAASTEPATRAGKIIRNTTVQTFNGKPMAIFDLVADWRDTENQNSTLGFLGELNKEVANTTDSGKKVEGLLRETKKHENNAQRLRTEIKKDVLSLFKDGGRSLSKAAREAITYGVLRTDLQALSSTYTMQDVTRFIHSHGARKSEIRKLEKGMQGHHIQRAKDLARYMIYGKGNEILVKNAFGIAADAGLPNPNMNPDPALVERIDQLVSLYALDYVPNDSLKMLAEITAQEAENGGIENLIKYHKGLVNDSKTHLFKGDPLNVTKGYLPEVTNQYRDVTVAYTQADADRLRSAMYIEVGPVNTSPADPSTFQPIMFYTEDAGKQQYISGTIALYNHGSKGRDVELDTVGLVDAINLGRSYLNAQPGYNPFESMDGMIPKYDSKGNIVGYRYEMASGTRDKYLERNNDFSDLIGAFTSLGYTKLANVEQNKKVVRALKEIYDGTNAWNRKKFVYVSYDSTDPVAYAAWDRLSNETKEDIKNVWGRYGMWVSNDTFLTVFGHPKESLFTRSFDKDVMDMNIGEQFYVTMMKGLFGENSRVYAAKTERMWQEMVALTKNFIVIRNVTTLMMNIASNTFLLAAHGVPITDIIQHTKDSVLGGIQYRKDLAQITKLEARQRSGIGDANQLQNEINVLRNRMQKNPMHSFVEAGMFSGIVEDIDPSQDMYSYQSSLQRKFEGKYEKLPKMLRTGLEYAFVTPSTPLYQFLHSSTQYSDFSAKYVLYKFYTEKAEKKLSHEDALQEASDNFINYDVPTSPWMQYANDMGLLMFTKYNLRIQKALFKLLAERPASALSQAVLMNQVSSLPPGIDPIVFNQYGNPFRDGAFGFLDVWDEPFPIKLLQ